MNTIIRNKVSQWQSPGSQSPLDEDFRQVQSMRHDYFQAQPTF